MTKITSDFAWEGCDPELARALDLFNQRWGPYSIEARRYSIFRLWREVIDPAWNDLKTRFPTLSKERMSVAWKTLQLEFLEIEHVGGKTQDQRLKRAEHKLIQSTGKVNSFYALSEIARRYGFTVLDSFLKILAKTLNGCDIARLGPCFDSLRELALASKSKKARQIFPSQKRDEQIKLRKLNTNRARLRPFCKFCGEQTELATYFYGESKTQESDTHKHTRFSAFFCKTHKSKDAPSEVVRSAYLKVKRSETQFDVELSRLERQFLGASDTALAKSGNAMVDEYIRHFIEFLRHGSGLTESQLRDEARLLIDNKISDTKKEIIMRLANGENQSKIARALGLSRQAIFKSLFKVGDKYIFDLIFLTKVKALNEQREEDAKKIWDNFGEDEKSNFISFERLQQK